MDILTLSSALELMREIVQGRFASRGAAISGAALKSQMMQRAALTGQIFQERPLGFRSFLEFVNSESGVVVERSESGGDFLVKPLEAITQAAAISPQPEFRPTRFRDDIWLAFMSFPKEGFRREYSKEQDRVLYPPDDKAPHVGTLIEPIPKEQQLAWREEFATIADPGIRDSLVQALTAPNPMREFAIKLRVQPDLLKKWNQFLISKVQPIIGAWAEKNNIPTDVWTSSRNESEDTERRALYKMLDEIPIEELLELKAPFRWFLKKKR
jgi:Uncharacterised protein family (UPF0158)